MTLKVTDEDNASDFLLKSITVLNRAPLPSIGMGTAAPVSLEPVVFTSCRD